MTYPSSFILLLIFVIASLYPLLNIQKWIKESQPMTTMVTLYTENVMPQLVISPQETSTAWQELLPQVMSATYWGVVLILSLRFLVQLASIIRLRLRSHKALIEGRQVYLLTKESSPFSFFRWIFLYPQAHTENEISEIITHEETHVRQWHSIDVILGELMCIACWINPFVWLMKREIRNNLEYMADHQVLETGYDSRTYQYHLLGLAHHTAAAKLTNNFNVLPLKNRIKMMNKKRTRQIGRTKYLMFFPLAALLLIISNIETVARTAEKLILPEKTSPEITIASVEATEDGVTTFHVTVTDPSGTPISNVQIQTKLNGKLLNFKTGKDGKTDITLDMSSLRGGAWMHASTLKGEEKSFILQKGEPEATVVIGDKDIPSKDTPYDSKKEEEAYLKKINRSGVMSVPEKMPEFPGGLNKCIEYINKNMIYPEEAIKKNMQGRTILQFIINKDGSVSDIEVARSSGSELLDNEAIRVVKSMPKWTPGEDKGKKVDTMFTMPFMFRIS